MTANDKAGGARLRLNPANQTSSLQCTNTVWVKPSSEDEGSMYHCRPSSARSTSTPYLTSRYLDTIFKEVSKIRCSNIVFTACEKVSQK